MQDLCSIRSSSVFTSPAPVWYWNQAAEASVHVSYLLWRVSAFYIIYSLQTYYWLCWKNTSISEGTRITPQHLFTHLCESDYEILPIRIISRRWAESRSIKGKGREGRCVLEEEAEVIEATFWEHLFFPGWPCWLRSAWHINDGHWLHSSMGRLELHVWDPSQQPCLLSNWGERILMSIFLTESLHLGLSGLTLWSVLFPLCIC